ncbi:MAG TPA: YfhO family protein [Candidatus Brocadiia bacterium]|nr:YfhO family protein [Candidatus Brocadiales bacterium]
MKSNRRWIALPVFGLLSLAVIYFYDILSGAYLLTERDLAVFFIPPRALWVELVKHGMFPLWNPYHLNGHPLFATLQAGVFYPLNILYLFLPFDLAFNYIIVLHYFLAGFFTFLLLRCLNASYGASLISAITFMFSGYLLSVHNLLTHLLSVAWVPLVFLLFLSGLQRESLKFIIFSGLAACAMFLGGGVEIVYVTLIMICLLTFFWHGQTSLSMPPGFFKKLGYLGIFIAIFLGVSAVQLLPFIELSAHSIRAGGISFKEATTWSMHPRDLLQFFLPDLYGYKLRPEKYWEEENWLKTIYLGTIPFLLSLFFFVKRDKRVLCALLIVIAGSLILAFGGHTPVYYYLYKYVPYFDKIRYPVKFLFLTTLIISVTAGLGYDRLRNGINAPLPLSSPSKGVRWLVSGIFAFGFFTALAFGCINFFEPGISSFLKSKGLGAPDYNDLFVNIHNMKRLLCITAIFGLVIFVGLKRQATRKFLPIAVLVLLTFDLFFAGQGFYLKTPSEAYHGKSANMDFILSDKSLFRIFTTPKTMKDDTVVVTSAQSKGIDIIGVRLEKVSPGLNVERHIFDTWGSEVMILKRTRHLYNLITSAPGADSTNLLNLMNVKYIISVPPIKSDELKLVNMNIPITEAQMDELEKANTVKVYQNLNCLPRVFLVKDYKVVASEEEYQNIMQSKAFNPTELLLLDEIPHNFHPPIVPNDSNASQGHKKIIEKVAILQYNINSVWLQVSLSEPKFLFMSESYYPGWKAYIDGEKAHIYRANYAFRAVLLKPGEHKVEFVYDPWTFKVGLIITAITICITSFILQKSKLRF